MRHKLIYPILLIFLIPFLANSQNLPKDTIYGNVKRVREKVIFLTEIENPQLLYYNDYGHSGFNGPKSTIERFHEIWYNSDYCYYINYERCYDSNQKIIKENWYGKKDNLIRSYKYIYGKKERLNSTIESSNYFQGTTNHYFEEYEDILKEHIIYENLYFNSFTHDFIKYKNGKVITVKRFEESGSVSEKSNHYNEFGKLDYSIIKDPNKWVKLEENSYSYGIQDTIGVTFKKTINEYDLKNRLIKTHIYDLDSDNYSNNVIEVSQTTNVYEGDNLIAKYTSNKNSMQTYYFYYKYDKSNKLISKYCCDEDIAKAKNIKKYKYKDDIINELLYEQGSFNSKKMQKFRIGYTYKFDTNKNWIEIIKSVDGVKRYKWTREIEYY